MRGQIKRLVQDSLHGGFLKLLALAARIAFLVLIIPDLPEGVLSGYVFANSVAVLGATALILGLDEELPRVVGGDLRKARAYMRWFFNLSALGAAAIAGLIIVPDTNLAILSFLLAIMAGRLLGGIIRSIDPRINEQIQNMPWIFFIAAAFIFKLDQTVPLIAAMAASLLFFQYIGAWIVLHNDKGSVRFPSISLVELVRHGLQHGLTRLASNFFLLGIIRAPILWPVWLGFSSTLDQIAFAIAVGEMLAQFGRIPANHAYARWCRTLPHTRHDWNNAVISSILLAAGLFLVASTGLLVADQFGWLPKQAQNIELQIQALLLSATIPAFRMLRYLLWARNLLGAWVAALTLIMSLLAIASIYWLDIHYWFYSLALLTATGTGLMAAKALRYFNNP